MQEIQRSPSSRDVVYSKISTFDQQFNFIEDSLGERYDNDDRACSFGNQDTIVRPNHENGNQEKGEDEET